MLSGASSYRYALPSGNLSRSGVGVGAHKGKLIADGEIFNAFRLAEKLNRPIDEFLNMPESQFISWLAYFEIRAEECQEQKQNTE